MKTFNLFLETDSEEHGDFFSYAIEVLGKKKVQQVANFSTPERVTENLWKQMKQLNEYRDLRPITVTPRASENLPANYQVGIFPALSIVGILDKEDSAEENLEIIRRKGGSAIELTYLTHRAEDLLSGHMDVSEISEKTGIDVKTVSKYRNLKFPTESIPVAHLRLLAKFQNELNLVE